MRYRYNPDTDKVEPVGSRPVMATLQIIPDIPGYVSHGRMQEVDGKLKPVWVDGRRDRREDLKRSGCREVDPSEFKDIQREGEQRLAERRAARQDPSVRYERQDVRRI